MSASEAAIPGCALFAACAAVDVVDGVLVGCVVIACADDAVGAVGAVGGDLGDEAELATDACVTLFAPMECVDVVAAVGAAAEVGAAFRILLSVDPLLLLVVVVVEAVGCSSAAMFG